MEAKMTRRVTKSSVLRYNPAITAAGESSMFQRVVDRAKTEAGKIAAIGSLAALCFGGNREALAQSSGLTMPLRDGAIGLDSRATDDMRTAGTSAIEGRSRPAAVIKIITTNRCELVSLSVVTTRNPDPDYPSYDLFSAKVACWDSKSALEGDTRGNRFNWEFPRGTLAPRDWGSTMEVPIGAPWPTHLHQFRFDQGTNSPPVLDAGTNYVQVGFWKSTNAGPLVQIVQTRTALHPADGRLTSSGLQDFPDDGVLGVEAEVRELPPEKGPPLQIRPLGDGRMRISWAVTENNYLLETSPDLSLWQATNATVSVIDGVNCVDLDAASNQYFRLRKN